MYQRNRGRQFMIIGIGVVLLGVVGYALLNAFSGGSSKPAATPESQVVVALAPIPQGTTFQAGQPLNTFFGVRNVPKSLVPFGAYTSLNQIQNLINSTGCQPTRAAGCRGNVTVTQTIYQNLPVVSGMFSTLGEFRSQAGPAFQIPYGYVGISVSLTDANSVSGSIQPGDDVDLIASYTNCECQGNYVPKQTQYALNDIRVIAVNGPPAAPSSPASSTSTANKLGQTSNGGAGSGGSIMLLVRYQQALIIQHLKDFGGSWTMSVVLRSSKETDIPHFKTLPVFANWFFSTKQENHFDWKPAY